MKNELEPIALSIRSLSIDAIEKAKSGHPGLPLGAAELAAALYGKILKHNPADPHWKNRDRFILSAGHGSMLLYSALHLAGYPISLDDIKNFRQLDSKCPGHPEYGITPGVEMTTGPLGQGVSAAVGMAVAECMAAANFNTGNFTVVDHYTYALVGEGCLMEGVSSEACSLAGHLKLNKLIVYYDQNNISIDGSTDITFTEDIAKRYEAYGWQVLKGSMYSYSDIIELTEKAKKSGAPTLIILKSTIGKGAPTVENKSAAHGAPLGTQGIEEAKKKLGLNPCETFFADKRAYAFFEERRKELAAQEAAWEKTFKAWAAEYPEKKKAWDKAFSAGAVSSEDLDSTELPQFALGENLATRSASQKILSALVKNIPSITGGSADLQAPNAVCVNLAAFTPENRAGRYIYYGVREFGMAAITNGIQLHGGFRAFCATFLVFADYLRPAIRLAALMKLPSVFVFTHDSVFVGEDGPTHQPVETLASLRAIPNLLVLRPADAEETAQAWKLALSQKDKPVCLILSRQNLPVIKKEDKNKHENFRKGAYIVKYGSADPDTVILATGSEVSMAVKAAEAVKHKTVRVVSVSSKELFEASAEDFKNIILGGGCPRIITAEAGVKQGWEAFTKCSRDNFCIETFGTSAPGAQAARSLGFTVENLVSLIEE